MKTLLALVVSTLLATALAAQNDPPKPEKPDEPAPATKSLKEGLAEYHPMEGTVKVGTVATLKLADGWLWLDGADGRAFLTKIGNEPSPSVLGVAVPDDIEDSGAFAVYTYVDEGHVADDENLDFDALLADMKAGAAEESKARKKAGLKGVTLLGWAEPPHYDKASHKLYWAERLRVEREVGETLNYNVRVLGRSGHLVVNGVGDVRQLQLVAAHSKALLEATEFVDGQRYTDFKPEYDKIAGYGLGALVAGKIALKVGLFAKLGGLLKPLLVGIAVFFAWLARLFTGRKKREAAPAKAKA